MMETLEAMLTQMGAQVQARFDSEKRVLTMTEYLALFAADPWAHSRDAARYLRDCFDHFGREIVQRPTGEVTRWRLFDLYGAQQAGAVAVDARHPETGGLGQRPRLVGHEPVQMQLYDALQNFVRGGRANRLLLLHGPNGSAKSTMVACLVQALEQYSACDAGALYHFSWVFPRGADHKGIGFASGVLESTQGSFAHLSDDRIEVKLNSRLREHPLLLVPVQERQRLLATAYSQAAVAGDPPQWLVAGELSQKNQQIFQALLTAYRGDLRQVWAHVRVERYVISRRYRTGAVTIGPQMAVDAAERQITADHSLHALPASLSALTLYEPVGDLVDASGGVVEFSDLLKRPLDAWKYLLLAIEQGEVSLNTCNLAINAVLLASSNELHLQAFREHHEYNSFRGRLHLLRVPYLRDYVQEQGIYEAQAAAQLGQHVAPHACYVAALWAVLTRLRRSEPEHFANAALGRLAASLSPLEKAHLYALGQAPERLSSTEARELGAGIAQVADEWQEQLQYEGLSGASPRELQAILLDAANDPRFSYVSPVAVLDAIARFCERQDFEFLKEKPDAGYQDHRGFIDVARRCWLDNADAQLRTATGLVDEEQYVALFERYVLHVSAWLKKERIYNHLTDREEEADAELMQATEAMLGVSSAEAAVELRRSLMSAVAAYGIDHPGAPLDYSALFPRYLAKLKEAYFAERRKQIGAMAVDMLDLQNARGSELDPERRREASAALACLQTRFGYSPESARDVLATLLADRYT